MQNNALDYSPGGVPTGTSFKMTLDDIREILSKNLDDDAGTNRLNEICLIGLNSYFEGFCKDHFATIINIVPETLDNLKSPDINTLVDPSRVLLYSNSITTHMGFLVAEKFDFGSAQKINHLYNALLKISPFSKSEVKKYDDLLRDRNLIVHHGGTYTLTYLQQSKFTSSDDKRPFLDSITIDNEFIEDKLIFIESVSKKILKASYNALNEFISKNGISINDIQKQAIDAFLLWD